METVEVRTGERSILVEFDYLIEAPNLTPDGKCLIYNSLGYLYAFDIARGESEVIESSFAVQCNNDHVLSPDGSFVAVSHQTYEDGQSRIYTFPLSGRLAFVSYKLKEDV